MNRLHTLMFSIRGARLRRQIDRLQRRAGRRPYVPSKHLVPVYPIDPAIAPTEDQPGPLAAWFFVIALFAAYGAGCVSGASDRSAAEEAAVLARCDALHDIQNPTVEGGRHDR